MHHAAELTHCHRKPSQFDSNVLIQLRGASANVCTLKYGVGELMTESGVFVSARAQILERYFETCDIQVVGIQEGRSKTDAERDRIFYANMDKS